MLQTELVERLERTAVNTLESFADPRRAHSPVNQSSLIDEARHQVGDDSISNFAFHQTGFRLFAGADVLNLSDEVTSLAPDVVRQRGRQQDPDDVPFLMEVSLLLLIMRDGSFEHLANEFRVGTPVFRVSNGLKRRRQQLLGRIAHDPAERWIHAQPTPVRRDQGHADGRKLESAPEPVFDLDEAQLDVIAGSARIRVAHTVHRPSVAHWLMLRNRRRPQRTAAVDRVSYNALDLRSASC